MFELNVRFSNVEDIEEFHKVVCNMNCDVDAVKGSYVVDAKSFMGLLTMDSSTPITVIDEQVIWFGEPLSSADFLSGYGGPVFSAGRGYCGCCGDCHGPAFLRKCSRTFLPALFPDSRLRSVRFHRGVFRGSAYRVLGVRIFPDGRRVP